MSPKEYLVTRRALHWCILSQGVNHGPFIGRQAAIDSAVTMAKKNFSQGITAIVMIDDDGQMSPVYDSTSPVM